MPLPLVTIFPSFPTLSIFPFLHLLLLFSTKPPYFLVAVDTCTHWLPIFFPVGLGVWIQELWLLLSFFWQPHFSGLSWDIFCSFLSDNFSSTGGFCTNHVGKALMIVAYLNCLLFLLTFINLFAFVIDLL